VALAPFTIRWGPEASGDVLRRSARCADCGGTGVTITVPSWKGMQDGAEPFPIERLKHRVGTTRVGDPHGFAQATVDLD
jgi:hypothetical protein